MKVYDPEGEKFGKAELPTSVEWCNTALDVANDADAVVVITEWNEFRAIDLDAMRARMRGHILMDLRNIFRPSDAQEAGLIYRGIGRGAAATMDKVVSSGL